MPRYGAGAVVFVVVAGVVGAETPSPPSRSYAAGFMAVVVVVGGGRPSRPVPVCRPVDTRRFN
jgi:hypothetical protein